MWENEKGLGKVLERSFLVKMRTKKSWLQKYLQSVWSASVFLIWKKKRPNWNHISGPKSLTGKEGGAHRHTQKQAHTLPHTYTHLNKQNRSLPVSRFSRHSWLPFRDPPCSVSLYCHMKNSMDQPMGHQVLNNLLNWNCWASGASIWFSESCCNLICTTCKHCYIKTDDKS